ncbi:MAG: diguanylate cyclase domain-containing protein, partial [Janthinobacterium lividum]
AAGGVLENADVKARPWFNETRDSLRAYDYHPAKLLGKLLPETTEPWRFIDMAMPVRRSDGEQWGVVAVHMSWSWARRLARDLLTPALRGYGAEILVVRSDGTVLLGPKGMEEQILSTDSLRLAQQGQTGALREIWADKNAYLTGYSQTGHSGDHASLQWSVLVRQREDVALAASRQLEKLLLGLSIAVGSVMAIGAALLARRLTQPMNDLSRIIEQRAKAVIAGRTLPAIPQIGSFREAQVLSQAMREMVHSEAHHINLLQALNDQLESTVAERTSELENLVMCDVLTGLPNRRALMQKLPEAMRRAARSKQACAVLFLDLDGFKGINDTYGHEEGDELLRQFGARIVDAVRTTDTVARLAGDEFVVLLENLVEPFDSDGVGRKILPRLRRPFELKTVTVNLSASIGIAVHVPGSGEDRDALLARADRAMYDAKRAGKNNVVVADHVVGGWKAVTS